MGARGHATKRSLGMKKFFCLTGFLLALAIFYGCVQPRATSQNSASQPLSSGDPGVLIFPVVTTFQPETCVDYPQQSILASSSSSAVAGWDRDSLGAVASQISYLRPSVDVSSGQLDFVFCNSSQSSITVPAKSAVMYEIFNGNPEP